MFLSIIIPHYNLQRELLERCIESIVKQEMPSDDYEIIIVDDGSITPPVWVEELYPCTNIRLLNEPHGGPGAARNRGIEEAYPATTREESKPQLERHGNKNVS